MFEDLPLDEFGNRVPPITAEVSWAGAADAVANIAAINSSYQPDHFTIDPTHNRGFVRTGSTGSLVRLNLEHHDRGVPAADHRDLPGLPCPSPMRA